MVLIIKTLFICLLAIAIRGTVPRYRFDQATLLNWKHFIFVWFLFLLISISIIFLVDFSTDDILSIELEDGDTRFIDSATEALEDGLEEGTRLKEAFLSDYAAKIKAWEEHDLYCECKYCETIHPDKCYKNIIDDVEDYSLLNK